MGGTEVNRGTGQRVHSALRNDFFECLVLNGLSCQQFRIYMREIASATSLKLLVCNGHDVFMAPSGFILIETVPKLTSNGCLYTTAGSIGNTFQAEYSRWNILRGIS